jgi:Uma2 family endonuclease
MTDLVKDRIRATEYFALQEATQPTQLIDGEIIEMPSPTPEHHDAWAQLSRNVAIDEIEDTIHALHPHHARLGG